MLVRFLFPAVIALAACLAARGANGADAPKAGHGDAHGKADAHGTAHGGGAHSESPLSGDLGNILSTLVIFITLLIVLGKFAWTPLLKSLQERENFIKELVDKAERDRRAAADAAAEYEQKLATAKDEVKAIIDEGRKDAERLKADIVASAGKEADETRARVRREIETARDQALKEIYDVAGRLAIQAASKILERELKPEDHRKIVNEAIEAYRKN
jgi:F-type H+-transporting ATPase subunit b